MKNSFLVPLFFILIVNVCVANENQLVHTPEELSKAAIALAGSWKGTVDDRTIEIALWPYKNSENQLIGLAYIPQNDCLLSAMTLVDHRNQLFVSMENNYSTSSIRENNCKCIDCNQDEKRFYAEGAISANESLDLFVFRPVYLYLGKKITEAKTNSAQFIKSAASEEMLSLIDTYGNDVWAMPDAQFIIQIKKDGGLALSATGKKELNKPVKPPLHSKAFVQTHWKSDLYFTILNEITPIDLEANINAEGKLSIKIKNARTNQCLGQLYEDEVYDNGYIVSLSSNPETSCHSERVSRGYLYFYYPASENWPRLQLFDDKGEMIAKGALDGIVGGLPDVVRKYATSDAEKKIKSLQDEIALAKLEEIKPQTIFTQCRILEIKWDNRRNPKWCQCLDEQYSKILSPGEYAAAVEDYKSFRRVAGKPPSSGGNWRLYNVQNYCRECKENDYKGGCLQNDNKTPNSTNYTRILNALLKGEYGSIENNILFKNFFIDYIHAYSDWCGKENIRSGKSGKIRRRISWKEDQYGFQIGPKEIGEVFIESSYVDQYDRYVAEVGRDDVGEALTGLTSGSLQSIMNYTINKATNMIGARIVLNKHMNKGCMSGSVQKVYKGLLIKAGQ